MGERSLYVSDWQAKPHDGLRPVAQAARPSLSERLAASPDDGDSGRNPAVPTRVCAPTSVALARAYGGVGQRKAGDRTAWEPKPLGTAALQPIYSPSLVPQEIIPTETPVKLCSANEIRRGALCSLHGASAEISAQHGACAEISAQKRPATRGKAFFTHEMICSPAVHQAS